MFTRFCMGQNLRALFQLTQVPPSLRPLVENFLRVFRSDSRGTFLGDALAFDEQFRKMDEQTTWKPNDLSTLPDDTYLLLRRWISSHDRSMAQEPISDAAYMRTQVKNLDETLHTYSTSPTDSRIVYSASGAHAADEEWSAGQIAAIFSHTRRQPTGRSVTQTFLLVNEYAPLRSTDSSQDHYRAFPHFGGCLFYDRFKSKQVLICLEDVKSRFVFTPQQVSGIKYMHALPLVKVHDTFRASKHHY
jgi:hypothetical protein